MPVYLKSGDDPRVLLGPDGKVATDPACCCGGAPCPCPMVMAMSRVATAGHADPCFRCGNDDASGSISADSSCADFPTSSCHEFIQDGSCTTTWDSGDIPVTCFDSDPGAGGVFRTLVRLEHELDGTWILYVTCSFSYSGCPGSASSSTTVSFHITNCDPTIDHIFFFADTTYPGVNYNVEVVITT